MIARKAYKKLLFWKNHKRKQGLLVTGARQAGKTFLIRHFASENYKNLVEINLVEDENAKTAFNSANNSTDILLMISAIAKEKLIPGETLIFIDEVQEAPEIVTAIKFLVEKSNYDFILSGSLLGVELNNIRSFPVGYLDTVTMFPLDFEEYCGAVGIPDTVFNNARKAFVSKKPVDAFLHEQLMRQFFEYLIVGGMPAVVSAFVENKNIQEVRSIQENIIRLYKKDITKYAKDDKLHIKNIYDLIPSELNKENKRFVFRNLEAGAGRYSKYQNSFLWLSDAAAALPVYQVSEAKYPLKLVKTQNLFKLFYSDVGLLTSNFMRGITLEILKKNEFVNYGALFENAVAQELRRCELELYYYNNKKRGEIDFIIENANGDITLIEVKSGKDYKRHNALSNLLSIKNSRIKEALVLSSSNLEQTGSITYLPIYMTGMVGEKNQLD